MHLKLNKLWQIFLEKYFPKGKLKNKIDCYLSNYYLYKTSDFKTYFNDNHYEVKYKDLTFRFCENPATNFFHIVEGYLKKYKIKDGDVVIDCGAYQGTFSILSSKWLGMGW